MIRRTMVAVVVCTSAWMLAATAAFAAVYPPAPITQAPVAGPTVSPVVHVQGAPSSGGHALSRTGVSSTIPLVIFAGVLVLIGLALLGVSRRRRFATGPPHIRTA